MDNASGQFPGKANDTVEWRGVETTDQFQSYAIIYRVNGYLEDTRKTRTRLLVFQLRAGRAKDIGHVEGPGEDAKAKQLEFLMIRKAATRQTAARKVLASLS